MAYTKYEQINFRANRLEMIEQANEICEQYAAQGLTLTLRQLYYQHVARGLIANEQKEYDRLGELCRDARMAGLMDWDHLIDRTRNLMSFKTWKSPEDAIKEMAQQYHRDLWAPQKQRIECLPPEQTVHTHRGYVPITEVEVGDMVLTHTGRWQPVTELKSHWHKGEMLTVKARGCLPVRMTPNHPIWGRLADKSRPGYKGTQRKYLGDFDFQRADAFSRFDQVTVPVPQARRPVGWIEMFTPSGRGKRVSTAWTKSLRQVIGLYLAEGRVREDGRTVQFTLGEHELHHRDVLTKWATEMGLSIHEVVSGGARQVYLYSRALTCWLEDNFGTGAYAKRIPLWLLHAPDAEQMEVAEYYFRGDGGIDPSTSSYCVTSRSHELIQSIRVILVRSGIVAGVSQVEDHGAPRYAVKVSGSAMAGLQERWGLIAPAKGLGRSQRYNYFALSEAGMQTPVWEVTSEPYEGMVYNIEVAEDHSYVAEIAVHNCWIEKDAAIGVVEGVCSANSVPYFSCRGYTSMSEMHSAAQRIRWHIEEGNQVTILHIGDHDPSGLDMSRDIEDRLRTFINRDWRGLHGLTGAVTRGTIYENMREHMRTKGSTIADSARPFSLKRIALNLDQIEQYSPPPNPAKGSDARYRKYVEETGMNESWELDALEPTVLSDLIQDEIDGMRSERVWAKAEHEMEKERLVLTGTANWWSEVAALVEGKG